MSTNNNNTITSSQYDFSATSEFLTHEISLSDLKQEVLESALGLSRAGLDADPITHDRAIRDAQLTALLVIDFIKTIKEA